MNTRPPVLANYHRDEPEVQEPPELAIPLAVCLTSVFLAACAGLTLWLTRL